MKKEFTPSQRKLTPTPFFATGNPAGGFYYFLINAPITIAQNIAAAAIYNT